MNGVAQGLALTAAAIHVVVGLMESFFLRYPAIATFLHQRVEDLPVLRIWTFNQGFYNVFLAAGIVAGVVALHAGDVAAGRALVTYCCCFMIACSVVLLVSSRRHWDGTLGQGVIPLLALVAAWS